MLRIEAWVVILGSYALLALAYLWPQDYRNITPAYVLIAWLAFLTRVLQFHLGLLLAAVALVAALGRNKRLPLAAAPLILLLLGPPLWSCVRSPGGAGRSAPLQSSPTLRVMSANLLMINRDTQPILDEILRSDADVVLLQEYTDEWHAAAQAALHSRYPHSSHVARDDSFGVAIYERTPFVAPVDNRLPLGHATAPQTRAVIRFAGRETAVYNIHLLPPRTLEYTTESRLQFADLLDALRSEPLPYLVAGDWNLTPDTPQHRDLLRLAARDAHDLASRGRGATWPVNSFFRHLPGLRLDHVYLSPALTAVRCEAGTGKGSDHRPVIADIAWASRAASATP